MYYWSHLGLEFLLEDFYYKFNLFNNYKDI